MKRIIQTAFFIWLQIVALAAAETTIGTTEATVISGQAAAEIVGESVLLTGGKPTLKSGFLISVETDNEKVSIVVRKSLFETVELLPAGQNRWLCFPPKGTYSIEVVTFGPGLDQRYSKLEVGDVPNPPDPPDPDDEAPIPDAGFRVVVIYETAEIQTLPRGQQLIIRSQVVRDYLNTNCVKGADGTPEWRFVDDDTEWTTESPISKATKRPRDSIPWLIVSNGKTGYEGPLPATVDEFLALIGKYAPVQSPKPVEVPLPTKAILPLADGCYIDQFGRKICPLNGQPIQQQTYRVQSNQRFRFFQWSR